MNPRSSARRPDCQHESRKWGAAIAGVMLVLFVTDGRSLNGQSVQFEVASIKPNQSGSPSSVETSVGGRLTATNVSLRMLIQYAFGVKDYEIAGGPSWLGTEKYDIVAKAVTSKKLSEAELEPFLQALLADRFKLTCHREVRELPVYSLVVGKKGPRLTEHTGSEVAVPSVSTSYESGVMTMIARRASMEHFANSLGRQLARTVTDNTGLQGDFDFKLVWAPQQTPESSSPSIFAAVEEQLGLRREAHKVPVEIVVIDSAARASEN